MKKQIQTLKLTILAAGVAALSVGCASTGYASYDADDDIGMGAAAEAEVGMDADVTAYEVDELDGDGSGRSTVSALSFAPETRATWVNRFPWHDWNLAVVETYTFAVEDPDLTLVATEDLPVFTAELEPGAVFVEAAGGAGEVEVGRIIRHSPTPIR